MPTKSLQQFLDSHHVRYTTITHPPAFTAQEIAARAHISGKALAKIVMVKADGSPYMVVLPADRRIDFHRLGESLRAQHVDLMSEWEFSGRFAGCEPGAMPPFGDLYGVEVVVDDSLAQDEEIAFNAGTHSELVKLPYREFDRLAHPRVCAFVH